MSVSPSLDPLVSRLRAVGCVFAEDEARLLVAGARSPAELDAMVAMRVAGLPLEHVLGWVEFCGHRIAVDPGVFVPRRRTEFLVRQAVSLASPGAVVLDLCCGSGALGVAVASALGEVELHAADIDPVAVRCAVRNVAAAGGRAYVGDLYQPLPATLRGRVDILLANVPYVPSGKVALMPPEAREHEPRVALDGGSDGLEVLRRVAAEAPRWLASGGGLGACQRGCGGSAPTGQSGRAHLLVETSERQAPWIVDIFAAAGLLPRVARCDELEATIVIGTGP